MEVPHVNTPNSKVRARWIFQRSVVSSLQLALPPKNCMNSMKEGDWDSVPGNLSSCKLGRIQSAQVDRDQCWHFPLLSRSSAVPPLSDPRWHTARASPASEWEKLLWQPMKMLWPLLQERLHSSISNSKHTGAELMSKLCCNIQDTSRSYLTFSAENPAFCRLCQRIAKRQHQTKYEQTILIWPVCKSNHRLCTSLHYSHTVFSC